MNNIKSLHFVFVMICLLGFSSCDKYFGDVNVDPNNPTKVTPAVLLPAAQVRLAYMVGGDAARFTSVLTQHVDGASRQFTVIQNYGFQGSDVNTMWDQNIYSGVLQDLKQLRSLASSSPYYIGIAEVLEAYTLMLATDLFGDIPYTEALQGASNLHPKYDSQESIYTAIQNLLDKAIINFITDGGAIKPSTDDLIFGGDASKWNKFAHSLKARAYLHLGLVSATNYTNALTALANGLGAGDDANLLFGTSPTASAPWYQYNNDRNDISVGVNYVALMNSNSDPRVAMTGAPLGVPHPIFVADQAQPLMTYTEHKFIEAECRFKTEGATAATHQAYLDGISSSFDDLGLSSSYGTYVAQASIDPGFANLTLADIMSQKYIALFTDFEVYNDWRRTGIPSLTPNTGTTIPVRLPYPDNEVRYNPSAPKTVNIFTDKVWWDMN